MNVASYGVLRRAKTNQISRDTVSLVLWVSLVLVVVAVLFRERMMNEKK